MEAPGSAAVVHVEFDSSLPTIAGASEDWACFHPQSRVCSGFDCVSQDYFPSLAQPRLTNLRSASVKWEGPQLRSEGAVSSDHGGGNPHFRPSQTRHDEDGGVDLSTWSLSGTCLRSCGSITHT